MSLMKIINSASINLQMLTAAYVQQCCSFGCKAPYSTIGRNTPLLRFLARFLSLGQGGLAGLRTS